MAFILNRFKISGENYTITESDNRNRNRNNVLLVTGTNGSGKTRLLAGLASQFSGKSGSQFEESVQGFTSNDSCREPARVVVQTFSPFSRFPVESRRPLLFKEYLQSNNERYVAIGFTRAGGLRSSVSKDAISRIVRKLFTKPQHATPLAEALYSLGFEPKLRIIYSRSNAGMELNFNEADPHLLKKSIDEYLQELSGRIRKSGEEIRLGRELEKESSHEVADLIFNSIISLREAESLRDKRAGRIGYAINLDLRDHSNSTSPDLEGALTLARLNLLRVADCVLYTTPESEWRSPKLGNLSFELSIVEASSGEQQLLSSLFGLVAEMADDSLVLIDEPELSLHPSWQTQFLDLLTAVTQPFSGCHIVIATHSPLVAQRGQELGIPVLSLDERRASTSSLPEVASVEQTLVEVFEVPVRDSTYVSRLLLSLVMEAERDENSAKQARLRIEYLKEIYEKAARPDKSTIGLIYDALDIVVDEEKKTDLPTQEAGE